MFKMLYTTAALLAILHVVGLLGAAGYLYAKGRLTADKVRAVADILLSEDPGAADEEDRQERPKAEAARSEEAIAREQDQEEMVRRTAERKLSELHQKQVAVNLLMQKVTEDIEKLDVDRVAFEGQKQERVKKEQDEGFKKTLALLETAGPDSAKVLLFQGADTEEAARLLLQMKTRKGMKTIEAALEDPMLRTKALQVFKLVREIAPGDSEWAKVLAPQE